MASPIHRQTSWFVTLPIAAISIGFLLIVFFPTARAIRETRNDIRLKQDFIHDATALRNSVDQLEKQIGEIQRYRDGWEARMPLTAQLSKLFGQINFQARESGATTTHFDPQTEKSLDLLHVIPVKMDVVGSYAEVAKLLANLELMPETVWVDTLTLKRSHEAGKNIEAELKLEVFTVNSRKSS